MERRLVQDQMSRNVLIPVLPQRIISLVPSQTELLYDLGLADRMVGQTIFCVHPHDAFKSARKIGGTKKLNLSKIEALQPDLIIGNKEENQREQIEWLSHKFPVWMSNISTLNDALEMITEIGSITGTAQQASALYSRINRLINDNPAKHSTKKTAVYLIWKGPWMAAGSETFIHEMMQLAGFANLIEGRYPELTLQTIKELSPEFVLLSSEPYPFREKHIKELQEQLPNTSIRLVDGEHFSWYGSRMIKALTAFRADFQ